MERCKHGISVGACFTCADYRERGIDTDRIRIATSMERDRAIGIEYDPAAHNVVPADVEPVKRKRTAKQQAAIKRVSKGTRRDGQHVKLIRGKDAEKSVKRQASTIKRERANARIRRDRRVRVAGESWIDPGYVTETAGDGTDAVTGDRPYAVHPDVAAVKRVASIMEASPRRDLPGRWLAGAERAPAFKRAPWERK